MSGWRGGVVIMNTMEVLTLLLVIFTALAYIDGHNKRKQHPPTKVVLFLN